MFLEENYFTACENDRRVTGCPFANAPTYRPSQDIIAPITTICHLSMACTRHHRCGSWRSAHVTIDRLRELLAHGHSVTKTKSLESCQQLREPGNLEDIATTPEDGNTSSKQCATVIRDESLAFDLENLDIAAIP